MTEARSDISQPAFKTPVVLINIASGSTSDISEALPEIFIRHGLPAPKVYCVEPDGLKDSLQAIKDSAADLLTVYGGDGTCRAGAIVAREAGIPLVALPGGTMNMLPKALYGTDDWHAALEMALAQKQARWQVGGLVNDRVFFCGAILGDPIVLSEARESLRGGEVLSAVKQIPDVLSAIAHGEGFAVEVDGAGFETEANGLQIYCPFMTSGATQPDKFELASVPQLSVSELIGIGAKALTQDWRDSVLVKTAFAERVSIDGQGAFDVLLDGESEQMRCPIEIKFEPEGVMVLAPELHRGDSR